MAQTTSKGFELVSAAGQRAEPRGRGQLLERMGEPLPFLAVVLCAVIFALPIYWLLVTSLKSLDEVFADPLVWWPRQLVWANYPDALQQFPFWRYLANTVTIALPVAIGATFSSAFVA